MTKDELMAELLLERFAPKWKPEPIADTWTEPAAAVDDGDDTATIYEFPVRAA